MLGLQRCRSIKVAVEPPLAVKCAKVEVPERWLPLQLWVLCSPTQLQLASDQNAGKQRLCVFCVTTLLMSNTGIPG